MVDDLSDHERLFQRIKKTILATFKEAKFLLFGSTGANLAIKGSDIDIAVIEKRVYDRKLMQTCYALLV